MSPATKVLLEAHIAAIRRWHHMKLHGDNRGENSVLLAQAMMRCSAAAFAASDLADRFLEGARVARRLSSEIPIEERTGS